MTALAADTPRKVRDNATYADYPVNAASQIYKGSLVSLDATGNAIASADTAGTKFVGIATHNALGGTSDGDTWVRVESGRSYLMTCSSITQAMVGDPMVVVDSRTVDDAAGATNDIVVGYLTEYVSTTSGWVFIAPTVTAIPVAGVTASAAELNVLDGVTAGTVTASKGLVADASKGLATLTTLGVTTLTCPNFAGAEAHAGVITPTAGVAAAGGFTALPRNIGTWQPIAATSGTDTACENGGAFAGSIQVPMNCTITGVQYLVGSVGGTDKVVASLHDDAGALLANSALAGATVGTAAELQQVAFTAPYAAVGPGTYLIAVTFNGTTAKLRTIPAQCNAGSGVIGGKETQTFGTAATFTAPTTFTADEVPVASVY